MIPAPVKTEFSTIGPGFPVYIIAEIGSNHNHNFDMACELIEKSARAGVNAVKFQTFKASRHYSRFVGPISLYKENIYDLIETLEIDRSWHARLAAICRSLKIDFLDSPSDAEAVRINRDLNVPLMKVASFDVVDPLLLELICKGDNGVILSTGMATMGEIETAVTLCRKFNNEKIILLQCTSLYPAPPELSNLNAMKTLAGAFNVITGYSDHTLGDHIPIAAVAAGAKVIEKHVTLDKTLSGPDHGFAMEPEALKQMTGKIREVEAAMGDGMKSGPRPEEMEFYVNARRSIHAACDIPQGHLISKQDLVIKRPGTGIHPSQIHLLVNRTAKAAIQKDKPVTWDDL